MAKRLQEIETGDIYPFSESWAKDPRFGVIEQVEMTAPEPVVVITNSHPGTEGTEPEKDPTADESAKGKKG